MRRYPKEVKQIDRPSQIPAAKARRKPIETAGAVDKDVTDSRRNPEGAAIRLENDLSEQKRPCKRIKPGKETDN